VTPMVTKKNNIHPSAIVADEAEIHESVEVGPFTIVHRNVVIEKGTKIGGWCEIGVPTRLGDGSPLFIGCDGLVRSHSVLYESSTLGPGLITGHHVCIRELTKAGRGLQLGSNGDIQGHCIIGDYLRTHRGVHIGQGSWIGNFVWMFPDVLLTNDPTPPSDELVGPKVHDYAVLCAKATLLPGVVIGKDVVVGAHTLVNINVPPGMLVTGSPAKVRCKASVLRLQKDPSTRAYPWRTRFHRGYPDEVIAAWKSEA
jgi:acyl-[acyl carrier protein]--UDP-N-acetylglucosamine O-acyltransferase